ncbi:MAG: polymer-forming cytoskeletal protein, partial [Syntrophobacteria bacterium]
SDRLEVFASAKIIGTIQAPVLKMEPGAQINGRIVMSRSSEEVKLTAQIPEDSSFSAVKPHR